MAREIKTNLSDINHFNLNTDLEQTDSDATNRYPSLTASAYINENNKNSNVVTNSANPVMGNSVLLAKSPKKKELDVAEPFSKLDYRDFINMNADKFNRVNKILMKHGFNICEKLNTREIMDCDYKAISKYFLRNRKFVLNAVKQNGLFLKHVDRSLRRDKKIVLTALKQTEWSFEYADNSLKKNRTFMLNAIKISSFSFTFAHKSLQNNPGFVLEAVKQNGKVLVHANKYFRKNRKIVLAAVKQNCFMIKYADQLLRKDRKIALIAVKQDSDSLKYIDKSLKRDRDFMLDAIEIDAFSFKFIDESLKNDHNFLLDAVKRNIFVFYRCLDKSLKKNREIVLTAVKQDYRALEHVDESFKKDRDFMLDAIKRNGRALKYADKSFKKDREIVLVAVKQDGIALAYAEESLKRDREIVIAAVKQNGLSLKYADASLKNDPDFLFDLACMNINILNFCNYKESIWGKILNKYEIFKKLKLPEDSIKTFADFKALIHKQYNIEFIRRFRSIENLINVLNVRDNPVAPRDTKPLAILVYPKIDHNTAFEQHPTIDRLIELGYRVSYFEANSEKDAEGYLKLATNEGKNKADLIVLAGHGTSETLALGSKDLGKGGEMKDETLYIDTSDFKNGKSDINIAKYILSDSNILLYACSNGKDGKDNPNNLANTIARNLKSGVTIHSSRVPSSIMSINRGDNDELKVKWCQNSLYAPNGNIHINSK